MSQWKSLKLREIKTQGKIERSICQTGFTKELFKKTSMSPNLTHDLGPIRNMKVLVKAFSKSTALFLRSEMCVLVTISNVCNWKE